MTIHMEAALTVAPRPFVCLSVCLPVRWSRAYDFLETGKLKKPLI